MTKQQDTYGERRMRVARRSPDGTPPPSDTQLEHSILGDLLDQRHGAEAFAAVNDILRPGDFFSSVNALVFETICDIYAARSARGESVIVGVSEVAALIRARRRLDGQTDELTHDERTSLEDVQKLTTLFDMWAGAEGVGVRIGNRARRLRELSDVRSAIEALWTAAAVGYSGDREMFLGELHKVSQMATEMAAPSRSESEPIIEPTKRIFEKYLGMNATPQNVSTGFPDLDPHVSLDKQSLVVVGARSGRGKSSLSMQFAMHCGRKHGPALFVSTEMPAEQLALRAACTVAQVDSSKIRRAIASDAEYGRLVDASHVVAKSMTWICDRTGLDAAAVCAIAHREAKRLKRETGQSLSIVVIDYLQRIRAGKIAPYGSNREQQVAAMALAFKELARELDACVILPAQLNADGDKRDDERPRASDLRESKAVENEADYVVLIHNPEYNKRSERDGDGDVIEACELIVDKNRHGSKVSIPLWFRPTFTRFDSMTEQDKRATWQQRDSKATRGLRSVGGR